MSRLASNTPPASGPTAAASAAGAPAPGWRPGPRWLMALVLAVLLAHVLGPVELPLLRPLEHALYDARLRWLAPTTADARIVIVDIDERALAEHGRWPWRRALLAQLLEQLTGPAGARLVGLDLVLAEPDRSSGLATLERLGREVLQGDAAFQTALRALRPQLDDDGRLADLLRQRPVVLGFHLSNEAGGARIGELPAPLAPTALLGARAEDLPGWSGHGGNLARLQQAATLGAGHLNANFDSDGLLRRLPLLVRHDGELHGALSLVMARALLAGPGGKLADVVLSAEPAGQPLRSLQLRGPAGTLRAPVDAQGLALVPFAARGVGHKRLSAADVLAGRLAPGALAGKLVLVGVSAPGLMDQRATPVDDAMLGTQVHAHMLAGLLSGQLPAQPAQARWLEAGLLLALGGLLIAVLPQLGMVRATVLSAVVVGGLLAAYAVAWRQSGLAQPMAATLVLPPALLALHGLYVYRRDTGARRQLAQLFGQYVPPELVQEMSQQPARYSMRSRNAELTVLFADVPGFSGLAERMPPAELGAMMNLMFSHLTDVVRAHRGTLDKYIGDAVMAFWGAPLDDPDHARHAVAAALAMRERLPAIQAELAAHGWPPLQLNIGINTGTMVVGDMGSRHRRAYTVLGDAVNLAARLQSLCSHHDLGLVVGDATRQALGGRLCLALGHVQVRGRDAPVRVWQPLPWQAGENRHADHFEREWRRMREALEAGRAAEAGALLDALSANPTVAALCRWQRQRLQGEARLDLAAAPASPAATPPVR